jgi:hypothetical protein
VETCLEAYRRRPASLVCNTLCAIVGPLDSEASCGPAERPAAVCSEAEVSHVSQQRIASEGAGRNAPEVLNRPKTRSRP